MRRRVISFTWHIKPVNWLYWSFYLILTSILLFLHVSYPCLNQSMSTQLISQHNLYSALIKYPAPTTSMHSIRQGFFIIILQIYLRHNTPLIVLQSVPNYLVNILNPTVCVSLHVWTEFGKKHLLKTSSK